MNEYSRANNTYEGINLDACAVWYDKLKDIVQTTFKLVTHAAPARKFRSTCLDAS